MDNRDLVSVLRRTFWVPFIAIAAIGLSVLFVTLAERDRDRWSDHSRAVVRMARRAQLFALDRETGVRGFLLTGDTASLEPDRLARAPLTALLDSLITATADNPAQQRRAVAFAQAIARWDSLFARPAVAQQGRPAPGLASTTTPAGLAGKVLFDDVRIRFSEFESEEELLYRRRASSAAWLQSTNVVVTIVGLVALGVILAGLRARVSTQAASLLDRQTQLEEQASELEEQASTLEEQAVELEAQTNELQETVRELGRKNEELNSFSSSVAHDLRSPLRSIDGFSHMLLSDYASTLDDAGVTALKRIRVNAQRMGELIDGLLTLARVSSSELRKADVNVTDLAASEGDDIMRALPPDRSIDYIVHPGLASRGDARLLRVAVHNLVENAFKFTRGRSDARVEVGERNVNGERAFFVSDNGIGFDMRYASKLFGAFEQLHDDAAFEGTGIGLATVRRIVERHGGRIWAESEPERGATFYFTVAA